MCLLSALKAAGQDFFQIVSYIIENKYFNGLSGVEERLLYFFGYFIFLAHCINHSSPLGLK